MHLYFWQSILLNTDVVDMKPSLVTRGTQTPSKKISHRRLLRINLLRVSFTQMCTLLEQVKEKKNNYYPPIIDTNCQVDLIGLRMWDGENSWNPKTSIKQLLEDIQYHLNEPNIHIRSSSAWCLLLYPWWQGWIWEEGKGASRVSAAEWQK